MSFRRGNEDPMIAQSINQTSARTAFWLRIEGVGSYRAGLEIWTSVRKMYQRSSTCALKVELWRI